MTVFLGDISTVLKEYSGLKIYYGRNLRLIIL